MRVLIVEDEPDLLRGLARALRDEGYAVDTADNGEDGLFNAESVDYDAIILDVMLPRLDGWAVLARLRKQKRTPVLMLTARDQSRDRVKGLDTGADDYVVKPFDLAEIRAVIQRALRAEPVKASAPPAEAVHDMLGRTPAMQNVFKQMSQMSMWQRLKMMTGMGKAGAFQPGGENILKGIAGAGKGNTGHRKSAKERAEERKKKKKKK